MGQGHQNAQFLSGEREREKTISAIHRNEHTVYTNIEILNLIMGACSYVGMIVSLDIHNPSMFISSATYYFPIINSSATICKVPTFSLANLFFPS